MRVFASANLKNTSDRSLLKAEKHLPGICAVALLKAIWVQQGKIDASFMRSSSVFTPRVKGMRARETACFQLHPKRLRLERKPFVS